jgi:predicted nucleic acid-binding protein
LRFWDSSALLPLFVAKPHSVAVEALIREDPSMIVWWASRVECGSAVHRLRREGTLTTAESAQLLARLGEAIDAAEVVQPGEELATVALRLLASHPLRAADALQLAAALVWARERPGGHEIVCLDDRLASAALLEGFTVLPSPGL